MDRCVSCGIVSKRVFAMGAIAPSQANGALHARLAQEQKLQRRRDAKARLSRERSKNLIRALVCGAFVVALLVLGIVIGWVPLPGSPAVAAREPARERPVDQFVATRTGQILIPTGDESCQQLFFNNESGLLSVGKVVRCREAMSASVSPQPDIAAAGNLANALRDGFLKR